MRVLIVDDEEGICKRLQRELKKGGLEAEYTTSPIGVIEMLYNAKREDKPYELLFLDLRMPKMDGSELLKEIRKAQIDLDVIIITGYGDEDKAIEAIRLGAIDYLPKPISLEDLHTALFRVQQKKAMEAKKTLRHSILVVDDEKDLCDRIKRELDKEGYQTAVAYDGDEGLDYFKNNRVDVVIADIKMPRMSGLEMLKRCGEITGDFVSLIITGHGDHETAIEALRLGILNYLKKPVSLEELVISVDKGIDLLLLRRGLSARRRELEIETALKEQYARNLESIVEERTKDLRRVSQALRALSSCNEALLHATEESQLLHEICRVIVEICGYRMALVGYAEKDEQKTVRAVAQMGYEENFIETVNLTWADTEPGHGPLGTSIRTRIPAIFQNIPNESKIASWREAALKRGYASAIGLPLIIDSDLLGALAIYSAEPYAFDAEEVNLLTQLAGDLAYGIMTLRTRTKHKLAEETMERLRHQHELILNSAGEGIVGIDLQGNHTFVNPSATKMFGYEVEELSGKHSHTIWHHSRADGSPYPEEECPVYASYRDRAVYTKDDEVFWRKDGTSFPVRYTSTPILEDGKIVGAVVSFRDITKRKKAEEALRKSEEELKKRVKELEEFYQMAVGREMRMIELKEEIEGLKEELEKYKNKLET